MRRLLLLAILLLITASGSAAQTPSTIAPRGTEIINGHEAVAGEALVQFRQRPAGGARLQLEQLFDLQDDEQVGATETLRLLRSRSRSAQGLLTALRTRADVIDVQPNYIVHGDLIPNDPRYAELTGLTNISASSAWDISTGSTAQVVAVIDSGVDYNHPDLAPNMWSAPAPFTVNIANHVRTCPAGSHGFNVISFTCDPMDDYFHGTHVAGTIGAAGNNGAGVVGVNWTTRIMAVKFLDSTGTGTTAGSINAMEFAIQAKAALGAGANVRVLSNSYSGGPYIQSVANEITKTGNKDMLFVAAAGNSTSNNDTTPVYPASYPLSNIISVAASDSSDALAVFSNYGATSVHLAAPGSGILSTIPGGLYGAASGTSMAAPHVSGAAALLLSSCTLTTTALKAEILENADHPPPLNGAVSTHGRLNVNKALHHCAPLTLAPSATAATFVGSDTTTQGSWKGTYGSQGYALANDATSLPAYAQLGVSGALTYTWNASTTEVRALQRSGSSSRFAATWYAGNTFTYDLNLTDGAAHRVALYALDWDTSGRTERFDVLDAATGNVLDTRTISAFSAGRYLIWELTGHVQVRVTLTGGGNVVTSALFLDPAGGVGPNQPPTVTLNAPLPGASFTAPAAVPLQATPSDPDGSVAKVEFFNGTNLLALLTSPPYQGTWSGVAAGSYTVTAVVTDNLGATGSAAATITVTPAGGGTGNTALFVGSDTTTQGTWKGTYGSQGYAVANDATSLPAFAQLGVSGALTYTWNASTTEVRALQRSGSSSRFAATWYAGNTFTFDLNLTDGLAHRAALYALDWDASGRVQRYDVLDATTGNVLDTRTISAFSAGRYLIWELTGHVQVRVTLTGGGNVVTSALFLDPAGGVGPNQPPTVTLNAPLPGASFTAPAAVPLQASPSDPDGSVAKVEFFNGTNLLASLTSPPYQGTWSGVAAGSYTVTAVVTDNLGATGSAAATITVTPAGGGTGNTALFVGSDTTTQGTWKGTYGAQGYALVNDATSLPAYAQFGVSGALTYTWNGSTTELRALQRSGSSSRFAATWYAGNTFTFDLNLTDGLAHRVALYALDWDASGRVQRYDVLDATTGGVLDTRTISGFSAGRYSIWELTGHVQVRVTLTGGGNVVTSALFLDPAGGVGPNQPPTITLIAPLPGASFTAPAAVPLQASPSDPDGSVAKVEFFNGTNLLASLTSPPYQGTWSGVAAGTYTVTAVVTDNLGATGSAAATITVTPAGGGTGNTATFIGSDTTTQGTWKGTYGAQGYALVNDATSLPAYAQFGVSGALTYTWNGSTTELRALQRSGSSSRFAATWYAGNTFTFDLNLTDGAAHRVALYALDWDSSGRVQRYDVLDATTGGVLDTRTISGFSAGRYSIWELTGHVQVRVTLTGGGNVVTSALFLDSAGGVGPNQPPTVTLEAPLSGATFTAPVDVVLRATASDPDGTVTRVEFFDGTTKVATVLPIAGQPYQWTWVTVPFGGHTITAVATDNAGDTTTSAAATITVSPSTVSAPAPTQPSTLNVKLNLVGQMPTHANPTSPVVAGSQLLLIDQLNTVYRWDGTTSHTILARAGAPIGVTPQGDEAILNVASNATGTSVYVMFTSSTLPGGVPHYVSPRPNGNGYQVLCRYDFNGTTLSNPQVVTALDVNQFGHTGGGLAVLNDGTILFATGDNGDAGEDGRQYAQDLTNHLSKILSINPVTGAVSVLARGVRNVQRLAVYPGAGDDRIDFADLGGWIAEELNSIPRATLLTGAAGNNFGWGRNASDNKAREGTFYIDGSGNSVGAAPKPEPSFLQPPAEFGREGASAIAVTGPVSSTLSFVNITSLFGDLVSGNVYAITGAVSTAGQTVYHVNLKDSTLQPITLPALTGGNRPDPRFFNFPDGTAGVLLERTGEFYRLTEY